MFKLNADLNKKSLEMKEMEEKYKRYLEKAKQVGFYSIKWTRVLF